MNQKIFPAARTVKEFETLAKSDYESIIILDIHLSQLRKIGELAKAYQKKLFIHIELIQGLQADKSGVEFACSECNPHGILSTKPAVIQAAKQRGVITIQRVFLLDSHSFKKSCALLAKSNPDYIELLPGISSKLIKKFKEAMRIPVLAGGFIETIQEVNEAIDAGAEAITTSRKELWFGEDESGNLKKRNSE